MAGHSHWAGIKHKKKLVDAKRGKIFSKLAKQIAVAARHGGGDLAMNLTLKYIVDRAKAANMPKDNIERAIRKGTGDLEGESYEEIVYEGYGPGGVAIMLQVTTDNRNRTGPEIRKIFEKYGGSIGKSGSVAWQFERKAFFTVDAAANSEDRVLEAALEGGAEDVENVGEMYEVTGPPDCYDAVKEAFEAAGIETESAEVTNLPTAQIALDAKQGRRALRLLETLEDHDDVDSTDTNLDVTDELLASLEEEED